MLSGTPNPSRAIALVSVAGKVRREQDFSLRAEKTTSDELGTLTEAFNEIRITGAAQREPVERDGHEQQRHGQDQVCVPPSQGAG